MADTKHNRERKEQIEANLLAEWISGGFNGLAKELSHSKEDIDLLFELNSDSNPKIAWRSAYIIDMIHDYNRDSIRPYIKWIADAVPDVKNHSIKRHYCRILTQYDLSEIADGRLVDACFEWLQKQDIPIAVKAHCMMILYNLCESYPELIPELKVVLENLLPYGSKGEVNRAKSILKKLEKIQEI